MPALSNSDQKNGPSTSTTSELFCQINDPEDVGAIGKKFDEILLLSFWRKIKWTVTFEDNWSVQKF